MMTAGWVRSLGGLFLSAFACTVAPPATPANSAAPSPSAVAEITAEVPFRMVDDHILISATLNRAVEVELILDTGLGSPGIVIVNPEVAEQLGLEYVTELPLGGGGEGDPRVASVAMGGTLTVGGLEFRDQQVMVFSDEDLFVDLYADGMVGGTLFMYVVEIDYDRSVLNLYDEVSGDPSDWGHTFDLTFTFGIPVVEAEISLTQGAPVPVRLIVDTGVNDPLLLFSYSDEDLEFAGSTIEGAGRVLSEGLTGKMMGSTGRIPGLRLGPFAIDAVVASFPDEESMGPARQLGQNGMLGNEVLQRFAVVFDYGESRMFLKPNEQHDRSFEYNTAGLVMRGGRHACWVEDVIVGSPAEKAGIRAGDRIVAIDGRDIPDYTGAEISRIFARLGTSIECTIERGRDRFRCSLTLERLI